jgi:hypothetical protein
MRRKNKSVDSESREFTPTESIELWMHDPL